MLEPFSYVQLAEQRIPPIPKQRVLRAQTSGMPAQSTPAIFEASVVKLGLFTSVAFEKKRWELECKPSLILLTFLY